MITIFTDGASRGNPGPGGWGTVVVEGGRVGEYGGGEDHTTNNRMELRAAIEALRHTPGESSITLYSDSSYLIQGITRWVERWKMMGWLTRDKKEVLNRDLWLALEELARTRSIQWEYVGGHVGVVGNERCDEIASAFADGEEVDLYNGMLDSYPVQNILDINVDSLKVHTKSRRDAPAYSYISLVGGKIQIHRSWVECEQRVRGVSGARYKKSLNAEDEEKIIQEFSA